MSVGEFYAVGDVVQFRFPTRNTSGQPIAPTSVTIGIGKNAQTTLGTSGVTYTQSIGGIPGNNLLEINTGSDITFFERGGQYDLIVTGGSIGGTSIVGEKAGRFRLGAPQNFASLRVDNGGTVWSNTRQFLQNSVVLTGALPQVAVPGDVGGNVLGFVAGPVSVGTNRDKTQYALSGTQTFNNTGTWTGNIIGFISGWVTVGTNNDKTNYSITSNMKKGTAQPGFTFIMTDSTNHNPAAGLTVSGFRSFNGGAFTSIANAVAEISSGFYQVDLAASDRDADVVALRFTATGADDQDITLVMQP